MDPNNPSSWIALLDQGGIAWAAFIALVIGAYRTGNWLTAAAQRIAEWAAPLVMEYVHANTVSVQDTKARLRSIERTVKATDASVTHIHRRLDLQGICQVDRGHDDTISDEDSDDGAIQPLQPGPRKSGIIKKHE